MAARRFLFQVASVVGVALEMAVLLVGAQAADAQRPETRRVATSSKRVAALLAALQQAENGEQAAALLRDAALSEAELALLAKEVAKPSWTVKIETFKRTVPASPPRPATPRAHVGRSVEQIVADTRATLAREQHSDVTKSGQQIQHRLTAVSKLGAKARVRLPAATPTPGVALTAPARVMQVRPPVAGSAAAAARIERVEPRTVAVGETTVITGAGFGNTEGRVAVRTDEELFYCEVESWRDQRIRVRIPREVRPWSSLAEVPPDVYVEESRSHFGGSGARFRGPANLEVDLWVKLRGGEVGPWVPIEVSPDMSLLTPEVSAVMPADLQPGADFLIEGRNFGDQSDPHSQRYFLTLAFPGHEIRVDAFEWRDTYIHGRVHEGVSGVPRLQAGTLTVRNRLGLEGAKRGLTFSPALEVAEVAGPTVRAICDPRNIPLLCLVGETNRSSWIEWELENGWTVEDSWLDVDDHGANAGGYWENRPERDASRVRFRVVAWADAYSMVEVSSHILLKGPRGTSHQ